MEFMSFYLVQHVSLEMMNNFISADNEAYAQHHHLGPYPARCFETIETYVPHESVDEKERRILEMKMSNERDGPGCNCTKGERAELDHVTWQFHSSCPCAAANRSCDGHCHCGMNDDHCECNCHNQLNDVRSLQLGRDLELVDSWGIDCYSRTLIQMLMRSNHLSDEEVEFFIQQCLLPAISLVPVEYASDMRWRLAMGLHV